jgi:hypothetical protein
VQGEAATYAGHLTQLLQQENMQRHLAEHPRLGRTFRPLCRMLGIDPAVLRLPPVERKPRRRRKAMGSAALTHPTNQTNSDGAERKDPPWSATKRVIATRPGPSIEMQANPKKYPWYPSKPETPKKTEKNSD